jgi:RHS repeat-associated protein
MYLVNSSQALAASYRYDPFGNLLTSSGTLASANTYRFSSKEYIPGGGLYYYLYRFYDPILQRWVNRDPVREAGFSLVRRDSSHSIDDDVNLYTFVRNGPLNQVDPFGLNTISFTRPCRGSEAAKCAAQCPHGVKSCNVVEEYVHVPGKPPVLKSAIMDCRCYPDPKPPKPPKIYVPNPPCLRLIPIL